MKKISVLIICVFTSVFLLCACGHEEVAVDEVAVEQFPESGMINLELIGEYPVDTDGIRKEFGVELKTQFLFFDQITVFDDLQTYYLDEWALDFPPIEFNDTNKYMVITIGRELVDIHYTFLGEPYPPKSVAAATITFGEEYHGQTLYVYAMDKILLDGVLTGFNTFLLQNGDERQYIGSNLYEINGVSEITTVIFPDEEKELYNIVVPGE